MKKDISIRKHIELIVNKFYKKLQKDTNIKYFFKYNLKEYLKVIVNFWQDIVFNTIDYGRNVMTPHLELHKNIPFKEKLFKIWLAHFKNTVDTNFVGIKSNYSKKQNYMNCYNHANQIKILIFLITLKILNIKKISLSHSLIR